MRTLEIRMLSVGGEICVWKEGNLSIVLKWRDHFDLKNIVSLFTKWYQFFFKKRYPVTVSHLVLRSWFPLVNNIFHQNETRLLGEVLDARAEKSTSWTWNIYCQKARNSSKSEGEVWGKGTCLNGLLWASLGQFNYWKEQSRKWVIELNIKREPIYL